MAGETTVSDNCGQSRVRDPCDGHMTTQCHTGLLVVTAASERTVHPSCRG